MVYWCYIYLNYLFFFMLKLLLFLQGYLIFMLCKNGDLILNYLVLVILYFFGCKNENILGKYKLEVLCVGKQFIDIRIS